MLIWLEQFLVRCPEVALVFGRCGRILDRKFQEQGLHAWSDYGVSLGTLIGQFLRIPASDITRFFQFLLFFSCGGAPTRSVHRSSWRVAETLVPEHRLFIHHIRRSFDVAQTTERRSGFKEYDVTRESS